MDCLLSHPDTKYEIITEYGVKRVNMQLSFGPSDHKRRNQNLSLPGDLRHENELIATQIVVCTDIHDSLSKTLSP
jgi:hypothetical protein